MLVTVRGETALSLGLLLCAVPKNCHDLTPFLPSVPQLLPHQRERLHVALGGRRCWQGGKLAGEVSPPQGPPAAPPAAGTREFTLGINTRHCQWGRDVGRGVGGGCRVQYGPA